MFLFKKWSLAGLRSEQRTCVVHIITLLFLISATATLLTIQRPCNVWRGNKQAHLFEFVICEQPIILSSRATMLWGESGPFIMWILADQISLLCFTSQPIFSSCLLRKPVVLQNRVKHLSPTQRRVRGQYESNGVEGELQKLLIRIKWI